MSVEKRAAAIESIIGCGQFQFWLFVCCQWVVFPQAWNLVAIVYNKVQPIWTCLDNGTELVSSLNRNLTDDQKCAVKSNCTNVTYEYDYYSITAEWDLTCGREYILYFIMSIQMIGVMVGAPIFGQISDAFGRKWSLLAVVFGIIASGGALAASPNWQIYSVFIFILGFCCGGSTITGYVLMVELLSQKHRLWVPSVGGWPIAFAISALLAYLAKNWRILFILMNALSLPALGLIFYIGESPRWLLQAGRTKHAVSRLKRISNINKHTVEEHHWSILTDPTPVQNAGQKLGKKYTYWHLFSTRKMAIHTIVLSATFFCLSAVSYGFTFNLDKLSGSIYMNFFYMSCLRWIGGILTIAADVFIRKYGRRIGVIIPMLTIAAGSATCTILTLSSSNSEWTSTIVRILMLCLSAFCSPIWIAMGLSNSELFPTPTRNMASAFCSIFNRLGGVVMPQILYLGIYWKPAPYVANVVFALLCAILYAVFIPETKGQPLPQQMPMKKTRLADRESATERSDSFVAFKFTNIEQTQIPLVSEQNGA